MADLSTRYMGLSLPNPVIVSSSSLTASAEGVKKVVDAGAGAVVLKSLFEEDIASAVSRSEKEAATGHPEAEAYIRQMGMLLEPDAYLDLVETCVREVDVPVIASLNCFSLEWWAEYASTIEKVGADAIELNISSMPLDPEKSAADVEKELISFVTLARKSVRIPLSVKIGFYFSSLPHLARRLEDAGAGALVLFNRFYRLDIDIDTLGFRSGISLSSKEEFGPVLRWVGVISELVDADIAASTGVFGADEVIKVLLAGGAAAQICSVLYREGERKIRTILDGVSAWMEEKGFSGIGDFRSRLSREDDIRNSFYQRLQYVKALKGDKE